VDPRARQITVTWRSDGRPLWQDHTLLAEPFDHATTATAPDAAALAEALASALRVATGHTPGPVDVDALAVPDPDRLGEYPRTLDLRRATLS
jgi:uncharacterized protein (DUF2126 family)